MPHCTHNKQYRPAVQFHGVLVVTGLSTCTNKCQTEAWRKGGWKGGKKREEGERRNGERREREEERGEGEKRRRPEGRERGREDLPPSFLPPPSSVLSSSVLSSSLPPSLSPLVLPPSRTTFTCRLLSFRNRAVRCVKVHSSGLRFLIGPLISSSVQCDRLVSSQSSRIILQYNLCERS